jgi:hypothetical protein
MKISIMVWVFLGSVFCLNTWAADTSTQSWDKRFTLRAGAIAYDMTGEFSNTKDGQPKRKVDMDDLGLDDDAVEITLGATLRVGQRWRIRFDYFRYSDDATKKVEKDFDFDGVIIPVGGTLDSKLDIDLYVANLSYDIYRSKNAYFGIGLGVHVADFDLDVSDKATEDDSESDLGSGGESLTAPLPNLYVSGIYAFRDDVLFNYGGGWMSMSYGDYDGDLIFARGALEYWPHKNIGLGAGYSYISVDVDYTGNNKKETYDVDMPGPVVYLVVGF